LNFFFIVTIQEPIDQFDSNQHFKIICWIRRTINKILLFFWLFVFSKKVKSQWFYFIFIMLIFLKVVQL